MKRRQREHNTGEPIYKANFGTLKIDNGHLSCQVLNTKNSVLFQLDLFLLKDNRLRFKFNELNPLKERYQVEGVIIDNLEQEKFQIVRQDPSQIELKNSLNNRVILYSNPLKVEFYIGDYLVTSFNSRNLLKFEHFRTKP